MRSILFILGTRPEAIKLSPVIQALRRAHPGVRAIVCTTGQHRALVDSVFATFDIAPDYDLAIMRPNQALHEVTARALLALDPVLTAEAPALAVVQGDTSSAFCGALAAFYRRVPVAHVEAGLRTGDMTRPFPEEGNRRLIAPLAAVHFAPTDSARENLLREGYSPLDIEVTGNTSVDAAVWAARQPLAPEVAPLLDGSPGPSHERRVVLVTAHRRENFGEPLERVCTAVRTLAARHPQMRFVVSVHPNPNVQQVVEERLGNVANVFLSAPLEYVALIQLIARAFCVLTDSGGIQEEAPALGTPVLVLRDRTERPEGVASGNARLVGTDARVIVDELDRLIAEPAWRALMSRRTNVYGDGRAAERIAETLVQRFVSAGTAVAMAG